MGGRSQDHQSRIERSEKGPGKRVPGAPNPKPQRDAIVFSQGIEGVETGRDVPVVCEDDGDRGKIKNYILQFNLNSSYNGKEIYNGKTYIY